MSVFPGLDEFRDGHYSRTPFDTSLYAEVWMQSPRPGSDASADRADLEHLAVIAGFEGNAELAAAIVPGHDGRHGDDGFVSGVIERRLHAWLLAELDQIARGRERQLEAPAIAAFERLSRRHQDRVGGIHAVMSAATFGPPGCEYDHGDDPFWPPLTLSP